MDAQGVSAKIFEWLELNTMGKQELEDLEGFLEEEALERMGTLEKRKKACQVNGLACAKYQRWEE